MKWYKIQNRSQQNSQSCVPLMEKRGQSRTKLWEFFHIGLKLDFFALPPYNVYVNGQMDIIFSISRFKRISCKLHTKNHGFLW
jgi:hypothetical protein